MLTHYIVKHKPRVIVTTPPVVLVPNHSPLASQPKPSNHGLPALHPATAYIRGKYAYAQFLSKCPFKKGDFVFYKQCAYPINEDDVWEVNEIQEIWYLCAGIDGEKAKPLQLRSRFGNYQWASFHDVELVTDRKLHFDSSSDRDSQASPV